MGVIQLGPALAILALSGSAAATDPPAATAQEEIKATVFIGLFTCAHDRILAGPKGEVVAWEGDDRHLLGTMIHSPGELIVGRMHEPARSAENRLYLYNGGGQVFFPIRWAGEGGILFARTRDRRTRILSLDADGGPVREVARLGPAWWPIALNAVGHGGVEPLLDPALEARAKRIDWKTFVRGQATLGTRVDLLGARRLDLELVRIGQAGLEPVGVNAEFTHSLTILPDSPRYPGGIAYVGAPSTDRLGYLPYQRPLIDQATGRVAGKFGPGDVLLDRKGRLSQTLARYRRINRDRRVVVDASLSGETLMLLTLAGRGNRAIVRIDPKGISEQPICTDLFVPDPRRRIAPNPLVSSDTAYRPRFRTFSLDRQGRETMQPGRPILMVHRLGGEGEPRDAILDIHGGPAAMNSPGHHQLLHVDKLLSPGRDIVSLEYSGSIGGGKDLTGRLGELGMAALEDDLDAVVRWLDRKRYRRVFIVAVSFGGVPALVALDRHRSRFAAAFLFAPALRWPEPEEHVNRGRFANADPETQMSFERALLGGRTGRERFKADLAALVRRVPLRASDRFYFAERDPISMAAHLPPGTAAKHEVVPGALHMSIFATPEAWQEIEALVR